MGIKWIKQRHEQYKEWYNPWCNFILAFNCVGNITQWIIILMAAVWAGVQINHEDVSLFDAVVSYFL